ncbi:hypothetical protein L798_10483 [Zootermopsis nevadensis]|uniref:Uncharacterized protein n=1 Tax=Zootermopsis nevadensis TaxID=136037 RepID=A0A067QXX9_ZOONE|nr:hypothetical protein L798_10483 [Zootermopsis nevadensis]
MFRNLNQRLGQTVGPNGRGELRRPWTEYGPESHRRRSRWFIQGQEMGKVDGEGLANKSLYGQTGMSSFWSIGRKIWIIQRKGEKVVPLGDGQCGGETICGWGSVTTGAGRRDGRSQMKLWS